MPRQYVTPQDFADHPLGIGLGAANLAPGILDKTLWRASARVDKHCRRRLGQPGSTTLSAATPALATSLSLAGSLGFDGTPDTVAQIGSGATQETVQVGGISAIISATPYPATLSLYPGKTLAYAHNAGEAVTQYYYEQQNPLTSATSKMDQYFDFTQAGQIAQAHSPRLGIGENVRVIFLRHMPILQLLAVAVAYPWANVLDTSAVPSDLFVMWSEGWIRFPIGYFDPPDSVVHVTYSAGYQTVPDDVQEAVMYEAAAELGLGVNYLGALQFRRDDYQVVFARPIGKQGAKTLLSERAETLLCPYVNSALT